MSSATAREAGQGNSDWIYRRRHPEQTLLYRLVEEHYPRLLGLLAAQGRWLPEYVQRERQGYQSSRL